LGGSIRIVDNCGAMGFPINNSLAGSATSPSRLVEISFSGEISNPQLDWTLLENGGGKTSSNTILERMFSRCWNPDYLCFPHQHPFILTLHFDSLTFEGRRVDVLFVFPFPAILMHVCTPGME